MSRSRKRRGYLRRIQHGLMGAWGFVLWLMLMPGLAAMSLYGGIRRRLRRVRWLGALRSIVTFPYWLLCRVFSWSWRSIRSAWRSAGFWNAVYGTPALLIIVGTVYLAVVVKVQPRHEIVRQYTLAAARASAGGDLEAARVYYDRLALLEPGDQEMLLGLAHVLDRLDEKQRVQLLLDELAPREKAGLGPAHMWRAHRILAGGQLGPEELREVEAQLRWALHLAPTDPAAHALLGQVHYATGRWSEAAQHLVQAVGRSPQLYIQLINSHLMLGRTDAAQDAARKAQAVFERQVSQDPANHNARLMWAEATTAVKDYPLAVKILQDGKVLSDDPKYSHSLARVYIAWSDQIPVPAEIGRRLELLQASLHENPRELLVFDRLMRLLKGDEESAEAVRTALQNSLAHGQAMAMAHLVMGTDAGERGDVDSAIKHLTRACELDQTLAVATNNLAWFLANSDAPDLEKALLLIEPLARRWPEVAHFRDTRGQILTKLGRWKEALDDLEAALPSMPNDPKIHQALATVYQQLGMVELATKHSELAKRYGEQS